MSRKNTRKVETKEETKIKKEKLPKKKSINKKLVKEKTKKKSKKGSKKKIIAILLTIIILILAISSFIIMNYIKEKQLKENQDKLQLEISNHYNEYVVTTKETNLYKLENGNYKESGALGENQELSLNDMEITYETEYFEVSTFDETYYIYYKDIKKIDKLSEQSNRYKKYIVWNTNIITKDTTNFYDEHNNLVYTFNESFELPIIIKKDNIYGVEFNNRLLYVKKEDVEKTKKNTNTSKKNTLGVPVLNYHFVYDPAKETCNQIICHTVNQFETHLSYIKDNNVFTLTMNELEMYIDGEIQLPKSVVITIDDGRNVNLATEILDKYKLNATAFIVTSRYDVEKHFTKSEYVELHSHSHKLHSAGTCPAGHGQGGGLTCLSDEKILEDLKTSREELNGSTAFCYPFYEFTSHSIELLKKAGFTMAFAGEYTGGYTKAVVGINKFKIPRWVIVNYTSMSDFKSYVNGTA